MKKNSHDNLEFVQNSPKYYEFIRKLRNMDSVRQRFISQDYINKKQQTAYMRKHRNHYFLCLFNGKAAGYIGVVRGDIRIAVHPKFQRKGIGLFLVKNIIKNYPNLQAKVKIDNKASFNLFKKAGFSLKYYLFEHGKGEKNV